MGLDMYLTSRSENERAKANDYADWAELAYWRKFNALHAWFVRNVQDDVDDCGGYVVSQTKLSELVEVLKKLQQTRDTSLLPTQSGFFFGDTNYDEWYWRRVASAIDTLSEILTTFDFENEELLYTSSW
jgi:hypothetical protein